MTVQGHKATKLEGVNCFRFVIPKLTSPYRNSCALQQLAKFVRFILRKRTLGGLPNLVA